MAKFRFIEWLIDWFWEQDVFTFEWDEGNRTKSLEKHGITCEEAESVFDQLETIRALGEQTQELMNHVMGSSVLPLQGKAFLFALL